MSVRMLVLLATAVTLTGCTISTKLGPQGFQGGHHVDRNMTGSNLKPRDEADRGSAKELAPEDVGRLQQNTGSRDTSGRI